MNMNYSPSVTFGTSPIDPPPLQPLDSRSTARGSVIYNAAPLQNINSHNSHQHNDESTDQAHDNGFTSTSTSSPVLTAITTRSTSEIIKHISINVISSTLAVASSLGFRVYKISTSVTTPRLELGYENPALRSGLVVQRHSTNFFVVVGDGSDASMSSRILRVMDISTQTERCSLKFQSQVLSTRVIGTRLVVVLLHKIYVFDLDTCRQLHSVVTARNPHGAVAVYDPDVAALRARFSQLIHDRQQSPYAGPQDAPSGNGASPPLRPLAASSSSSSSSTPAPVAAVTGAVAPVAHPLLVYPVPQPDPAPASGLRMSISDPPRGVLEVLDLVAMQPLTRIPACAGPVRALAVGGDGYYIAVASTKGTLVRVLHTLTAQQLFVFRRGHSQGDIALMEFSHDSGLLACVNSVSNSIHLFSLDPANRSNEPVQETLAQSPVNAPTPAPAPPAAEPEPAPASQAGSYFSWSSLSAASSMVSTLAASTASSLASGISTFSTAIHSYIEPPRRFAVITYKPAHPSTRVLALAFTRAGTVFVATSDGALYVYSVPRAGGDCVLQHQASVATGPDAQLRGFIVGADGMTVPAGSPSLSASLPPASHSGSPRAHTAIPPLPPGPAHRASAPTAATAGRSLAGVPSSRSYASGQSPAAATASTPAPTAPAPARTVLNQMQQMQAASITAPLPSAPPLEEQVLRPSLLSADDEDDEQLPHSLDAMLLQSQCISFEHPEDDQPPSESSRLGVEEADEEAKLASPVNSAPASPLAASSLAASRDQSDAPAVLSHSITPASSASPGPDTQRASPESSIAPEAAPALSPVPSAAAQPATSSSTASSTVPLSEASDEPVASLAIVAAAAVALSDADGQSTAPVTPSSSSPTPSASAPAQLAIPTSSTLHRSQSQPDPSSAPAPAVSTLAPVEETRITHTRSDSPQTPRSTSTAEDAAPASAPTSTSAPVRDSTSEEASFSTSAPSSETQSEAAPATAAGSTEGAAEVEEDPEASASTSTSASASTSVGTNDSCDADDDTSVKSAQSTQSGNKSKKNKKNKKKHR